METLDVLIKLFDTLKEASDESKRTCQELITQQQDLVNHVKNLPISELKVALKEHSQQSSAEIDSCTETVETKTDSILGIVRNIESKVGKMILVVVVAFSIMTAGYFLIKAVSDPEHVRLEQRLEHIEDSLEKFGK